MLRGLRMIYGVAYLTSRWIRRQPQWILQSALGYIGFAVLLYAWGGLKGLENLLVAMAIAGFWNTGVNIVAQNVGWYRIAKIQDMLIASPVTPLHYLVGLFLSSMAFPTAALAAAIPIAALLGAWGILLCSIAIGLVVLLLGVLLGLAIVLRVRNPVNVSAITNPIAWVLTILPPVYYPATVLPQVLRPIAMAVPTAAAAEIARQLSGMPPALPLWIPLASIATWCLAALIATSRIVKWGHA